MKSNSILALLWAAGATIALWSIPVTTRAADIFVANTGTQTIGEYDATTGAVISAPLITGLGTGTYLAVSGGDIFVSNQDGYIGEYTTAGVTISTSLVTGLNNPMGIAVSGNDIFIGQNDGKISEYTTSGTTVNASLITGVPEFPEGLAISGNDLFVAYPNAGTVGEYTTSGSTINPEPRHGPEWSVQHRDLGKRHVCPHRGWIRQRVHHLGHAGPSRAHHRANKLSIFHRLVGIRSVNCEAPLGTISEYTASGRSSTPRWSRDSTTPTVLRCLRPSRRRGSCS